MPIWRWGRGGQFTVSSTYNHFINGTHKMPNVDWIWKVRYHLKVRMFMWLKEKDGILTRPKLQQRGWKGPNICVFCRKAGENVTHLVLNCEFSKTIWEDCGHRFGLRFDLSNKQYLEESLNSQLGFEDKNYVSCFDLLEHMARETIEFSTTLHTCFRHAQAIFILISSLGQSALQTKLWEFTQEVPRGRGPPLAQQIGLDRDDRVGTSFGETGSTDDSARGPRKAEHC